MVPLAGALGSMFGVCCNEMSADAHVVDFEYGCGAHSDTPPPPGTGSPMYDPYDDGVLDVVEARPESPRSGGGRGAEVAETGRAVDAGSRKRPAVEASRPKPRARVEAPTV